VQKEQKWILAKMKEKHPKFSLREWSEITGIQISRVFRIIHGYEMKIGEFLIIKDFLAKSTPRATYHVKENQFNLLSKSLTYLPANLVENICKEIEYKILQYQKFNSCELEHLKEESWIA